MFALEIEKRHVRAACIFAARNDVRYYLNGISIEAGATESRIVATDGHRLCVIRGRAPEYDEAGFSAVRAVILPLAPLLKIKKPKAPKKHERKEPETVRIEIEGEVYTLTDGDTSTAGRLIDGKFPDWRRVVPAKTSGMVAQFNPDYLADCRAAGLELGSKCPSVKVQHNGDERGGGPGIVTIGDCPDFLAVVMPYRVHEDAPESFAWVHEPIGKEPEAEQTAEPLAA